MFASILLIIVGVGILLAYVPDMVFQALAKRKIDKQLAKLEAEPLVPVQPKD
jgi:hypothetical protein